MRLPKRLQSPTRKMIKMPPNFPPPQAGPSQGQPQGQQQPQITVTLTMDQDEAQLFGQFIDTLAQLSGGLQGIAQQVDQALQGANGQGGSQDQLAGLSDELNGMP